ncbi:MAG TPA: NAD-dependent epimerase/dehydratase family protein [Lamprocystis sp. (in: g-proteobacteria)]|nr:NAD-dependent epimerase/dehydratase family protein [Lamprocystis sp. (in: g-proteobacteria)]
MTGASGFIGSALCQRLKEDGWRVRALMRRPAQGPWDESFLVDLGREPVPLQLLAGVDCVFHLAGKAHALAQGADADEAYRLANYQSTLDLLAGARAKGVRGFVFFSSVKAMGEGRGSGGDAEPALATLTPYGRSKRLAEEAVLTTGAVTHPVVLRPSLVYGPHPKGYLNLLIRAIRAGWFPPLPELGNKRSMVHRDDLVTAALRCAVDPRARGQAYVVTDGTPYSTRQVYEFILESLGRRAPGWTLPVGLLRLAAVVGDALGRASGRHFLFDSEVLDKLIGSALYDGSQMSLELDFAPRRGLRESMPEMVATTQP